MSKLNAFIFDLDGVIADTVGLHYKSWQKLADHLGFELSKEIEQKFRGASRMKSLNMVLDEGHLDATEDERKEYSILKNKWYHESLDNLSTEILLPGVEKLLQELHKSSIKVGLASASRNAKEIIKRLNFEKYFDAMVDGNDVVCTKPDPEVFLTTALILNILPRNALVLEDSPLGIEAALKGDFFSLGIGQKEALSEAHFVIPGFENINLNDILTKFSQL